jgi:predicted metallo-beta-lactamase superfamily hydrolase
MATFIETGDCAILIDPGVELAPQRSGLSPHPLEIERREEHWNKIKARAKKSDILIVTHYHYDHHNPKEPEVYKGKKVFLKHPTEHINLSQKGRASHFLKNLGTLPEKIEYSDGREFKFGKTEIIFSKAVPHGMDAKLGYVTEVCVREGKECFLHTSDVEGAALKEQVSFVLEQKPQILICDGPMTFLMGPMFENIKEIITKVRPKKFVIDHHYLRDKKWKEKLAPVYEVADKQGVALQSAAEFLGLENDLLEANRKELYKQHPV